MGHQQIDNDEPAFPVLPPLGPDGTPAVGYPYISSGASLRDYFAAKAMHQMLAGAVLPHGYDAAKDLLLLSQRAYEAADAMLRARKGGAV
jgi:hypothetical protein